MPLTPDSVTKLDDFLIRIKTDTYPEEPSQLHDTITATMLDRIREKGLLPPGTRVLDVGCGQGVALERFQAAGAQAVGITLNDTDVAACAAKGFAVQEMDQSFLSFEDETFQLVWCRHCLEHSVMPYFTLTELRRVLEPAGHLYVEVPAPDTSCNHQANPNHYSVLGKSMWVSLMNRAGFDVLECLNLDFTTGAGPDTYWAFILKKR